MTNLYIICGPEKSGKMPLARALMEKAPGMVLVSRDRVRDAIVTKIDEWDISLLMADMVVSLLKRRRSVVVCAWNMERCDRNMWDDIAKRFKLNTYRWLDTRDPVIKRVIPAMDDPRRQGWGVDGKFVLTDHNEPQ